MIRFQTQDSPRPRVGVKPPPWEAVGGCPCKHGLCLQFEKVVS